MAPIFENQDFIKEFIAEWGPLFPDANLLLESEEVEECGDVIADIKVTKEDNELDECNKIREEDELTENDRICEDVMIEFNAPAFDAEFAKRAPKGKITSKNIAIGTLLAAAIYYSFQTYRLMKKQGKDPAFAKREQVKALKSAMAKCSKTNNPKLCKAKFEKQIRATQEKQ